MTQSHTRCTYCRARKDNSAFAQQGDHVIPASIGGDWVDPQICATCEATSNRVADQLIATDPLVVFLRNAYQIPDRRYGEVPDACRFSVRVPQGGVIRVTISHSGVELEPAMAPVTRQALGIRSDANQQTPPRSPLTSSASVNRRCRKGSRSREQRKRARGAPSESRAGTARRVRCQTDASTGLVEIHGEGRPRGSARAIRRRLARQSPSRCAERRPAQRRAAEIRSAHPLSAGRTPADYDDAALDRLADLLADRLAAQLGGLMPEQSEPLVDAAEIARLHGKTRWWVYEHAGELGAARLGCGPRPRLGFSPARVAVALRKISDPEPLALPTRAKPQRERRRRTDRTPSGAELLRVRGHDNH